MLTICLFFLFVTTINCAPNLKETDSGKITFENVTAIGYSIFTQKFKVQLINEENLQDNLPKKVFDRIDIIDQNVPILYKNSISNIPDLDELLFENNNLKEIQIGALDNLPQLRKLSLKNNKLEEIPADVFNKLPMLSTLELNRNQITTISGDAFDNMPNILNINLADNLISAWNSEWFKNTPLLTRISMQNNSLETLPTGAFRNLKGEKRFGSIDLKVNLIFSYNKIKNIENGAFKDIERINNLWLDNNELTNFDGLNDVQVDDLRLNSNEIKCFDKEEWNNIFRKGTTTHIDGNPFDCQCLSDLQAWVKENDRQVVMLYARMTCDAERLKQKMDALSQRLKEIKNMNEF